MNVTVISALAERDLLGLLDRVCREHHVTRAEVCSRNRSRSVANARHDLWWRLRHLHSLAFSYVEIGRLFERNHTTVLHGVRAWEAQMLAGRRAA
ncbi:MAG: helix-turn-helix domain-containing protein [Labilithrix sp.]